ncbi:MAG: helix-turn-helix domain-containing protein [Candidatus Brocadiales bacterium]|nr:helix-turn-helix domain-containing protein [Candidatus Brocadiales bacterium]
MDANKTSKIIEWHHIIEKSELSVSEFFKIHTIPFSRSQYYIYKHRIENMGVVGLSDKRNNGGNRKITPEHEIFLKGCILGNPDASLEWLQQSLRKEFNCEISLSAVSRALNRINPDRKKNVGGRPKSTVQGVTQNVLGGFELIIAVAYHLGWPQRTAKVISKAIESQKNDYTGEIESTQQIDKSCRNEDGTFTSSYNRRTETRTNRFASISDKRQTKNWRSMNLMNDSYETLVRKSLAILSLPIVTGNGHIRNIGLAQGQSLGHFCGFNYRQSSVTKCFAELKYLGVSTNLLLDLPEFWRSCWEKRVSDSMVGSLLCYYIDGNTKALWSSKRVNKNKVTMLGRVMGCLEQVFIHDGLGNPIYFETYSGHGPTGESILGLFEKIKDVILEVPGSATCIHRAIVMDGANNSVKSLRAFAGQDNFHYITTLDENQWNERRVRKRSYPARYRYGDATIRDLEIELEDSNEKGYLIASRAIKVNWDNGKWTVLMTSLPKQLVDASEVIFSYFRRWPAQELQFRHGKATVALHRVAGYGRKMIENPRQREKQEKLAKKIESLQEQLKDELAEIIIHEHAITKLIPKERNLRSKTMITKGRRIIPEVHRDDFERYGKKICYHQRAIKRIQKNHETEFKALTKSQNEWLRLQGKEIGYSVDVELDQILTYFRASLSHLYAYFVRHFLDDEPISMIMLLHRVIQLPATIEETDEERRIVLQRNQQDPSMMNMLSRAIEELNNLKIKGIRQRTMIFSIE